VVAAGERPQETGGTQAIFAAEAAPVPPRDSAQ
jgi:hypothetical protein